MNPDLVVTITFGVVTVIVVYLWYQRREIKRRIEENRRRDEEALRSYGSAPGFPVGGVNEPHSAPPPPQTRIIPQHPPPKVSGHDSSGH